MLHQFRDETHFEISLTALHVTSHQSHAILLALLPTQHSHGARAAALAGPDGCHLLHAPVWMKVVSPRRGRAQV